MANAHQKTTQAVVTEQTQLDNNQTIEKFALYRQDGANLVDVIADLEARVDSLENP